MAIARDSFLKRLSNNRLVEISQRHPSLMAFVLLLPFMLWLNLHQATFTFYYDSGEYWKLRTAFDTPSGFSLLGYNNEMRGYLLPLIYNLISKISLFLPGLADYKLMLIVQTIFYCGALTLIIPATFERLFKKTNFPQILFFSCLALYFWRGYFYYPLTDLLALFFLITGIYFVSGKEPRWWNMVFAGLFWGGMIIIRPAYQIALLPMIIWGVIRFLSFEHQKTKILLALLSFLIGLSVILLPQYLINRENFQINSPLVPTRYASGENLLMRQLTHGILMQKFEGNVGSTYPKGGVISFDNLGSNVLIASEYKDASALFFSFSKPITLKDYIVIVITHPIDFLLIYARHLFNGLDIVYNTPYVYDFFKNTLLLRPANYSLWFIVILWIRRRLNTKDLHSLNTFLVSSFILPSIIAIPMAIEVRFMLPMQYIAYGTMAFFVLPEIISSSRAKIKSILKEQIGWYLIFLLVCFLLSANTYTALEFGAYVFR